ncbi:hypothetical protein BJ170DRAFT_697504 [Xylariales sp. AK1849]|nr:hypothetical protein BJ170DRAFT_697504 [Xylariales sp. AK1849]
MMVGLISNSHLEPYGRLSTSRLRSEFAGKTVLITGGGTGIGASAARSFAEANVAAIVVAGRTEGTLKSTTAELTNLFPETKISYSIVDISSKDAVEALFEALVVSPDILVNNAGYLPSVEHMATAPIDDWWKGFEINVLGTTLMTQSFLSHHAAAAKEPKEPAVVVTVNSMGAIGRRLPNFASYAGSKIAIMRAFELMAIEVPDTVARFISIHPGGVESAMGEKSGLLGLVPTTNPQLSAEFIVWAASKEAGFLNGRFVSANWDVDELIAAKEVILKDDLLITSLKGY